MALVIAAALSAGSPALAQAPTELGTITVMAPRITYQIRRERGSAIPMMQTIVQKSAMVRYGDLDLTRSADLYTLESRVGEAAAQVCGELAQEFPEGTPNTPTCTRRAIDDAMTQVRQAAHHVTPKGGGI
jgi:UrcA family protein